MPQYKHLANLIEIKSSTVNEHSQDRRLNKNPKSHILQSSPLTVSHALDFFITIIFKVRIERCRQLFKEDLKVFYCSYCCLLTTLVVSSLVSKLLFTNFVY